MVARMQGGVVESMWWDRIRGFSIFSMSDCGAVIVFATVPRPLPPPHASSSPRQPAATPTGYHPLKRQSQR
jgi:hypothetical protein